MDIRIPKEISKELAEETGWHIGDGSMNYYLNKGSKKGLYSLRGHIIDDVEHYEKRIKAIIKTLYNLNIRCHKQDSTGIYGFQIWDDKIVFFKNKILKLPLGKKKDIKIPKVFLYDKEHIKSAIRGIFDTDGTLYLENKRGKLYPRIHIPTISEKLAKQLKKYINLLGINSTLYKEPRGHKDSS